MKILIKRIPPEGSTHSGTEPDSILELADDPFVQPNGDIVYQLFAQVVSEELVVRGKISAPIKLRCARCTDFFSTTITDSDFLRVCPISKEIDFVDFTKDMREDLLLHLPGFPLCDEGCKGLCEQCGTNQNSHSCSCKKPDRPDSWAALNQLNL
jgi:uncharacterized protein